MASSATAWILQAIPYQWDVSRYLTDVSRGRVERESLRQHAELSGLRIRGKYPRGTIFPVSMDQESVLLALCEARLEPIATLAPEMVEPSESTSAAGQESRPFDPHRANEPWTAGSAVSDPAETFALREKAARDHQALLVRLHRFLTRERWTGLDQTRSIDLWGVDPAGRRHIFEAKTIGQDNALSQCRAGLAQLLEYRALHGLPTDLLILAIDRPIDSIRLLVLDAVDIGVVLVDDDGAHGLNA